MKRKIILSSQYKKDVKLARRKLANDIPLPIENKDHPLKGDYIGYRECHIQSDWLLIYRKTDNNELQILELARTGTHSDLFKK